MKLKRGPSGFWAAMHRMKLVRAHMPFWRVVVEAKLDRTARRWPEKHDGAVIAVYVWARTIEEAEALASLALQEGGMVTLTADAVKHVPAAAPSRTPKAALRGPVGYMARVEDEPAPSGPSRRDART